MRFVAKLIAALSVAASALAEEIVWEDGSTSFDYSCVHANSWLLNTEQQKSTKYNCLVDVTVSGFKNLTLPKSGWTLNFTGIPYYDHAFSKSEIGKLNNRPKASSDFVNGKTSAVAGNVYAFGANIGFKSSKCSDGYWPPGPYCPSSYSGSAVFPVFPSPETKPGGCYVPAHTGYFVNGVPFWSWSDERTYNDEGYWNDIAMAFEAYDMDICIGHTASSIYHHHSYSPCLMLQLNDDGSAHSPVHGFANDGYPVYGPYQDADTLAVSCWAARDYSDPILGCEGGDRTCTFNDPWDFSQGTTVAPKAGPSIKSTIQTPSNNTIPASSGIYFQDYYYDASCSAKGGAYLDSHNGHTHDDLGYHYHLTVNANFTPTFPFTFGPKYYGCSVNGGCKTGNSSDNGGSVCAVPFTRAAGKCTKAIGSRGATTPPVATDKGWEGWEIV